jgi:hypothetical protein
MPVNPSTPTPAEQIDGFSIRELVCLDDKDKATRLVEKLLIRERLEERKAAALHQQVYTEDEFTLAKELGLLYPEDEQRIATLEQQLNEETEL